MVNKALFIGGVALRGVTLDSHEEKFFQGLPFFMVNLVGVMIVNLRRTS